MDTVHARIVAALMGQSLLSELVEAHRANPPKDLAEIRDPLRGRPVPAGTHQLLIEALGGAAAVRIPDGMHGRLARVLVG